jgi:hypothetical protein
VLSKTKTTINMDTCSSNSNINHPLFIKTREDKLCNNYSKIIVSKIFNKTINQCNTKCNKFNKIKEVVQMISMDKDLLCLT